MSEPVGKQPATSFTILLSDDDHGVRRSIQLMLRARGYTVRSYTSGRALLADPRSLRADCLVVDYHMPDVDGLNLLKRLQAKGWDGSAILISAYWNPTLEARAREAGFGDVIAKPAIARALLEAVAGYSRKAGKRCA
ncbi:MAG: response regulator [Sphingopyxis sp.]|nr:response regulator [Sphingopyxis sp.]